MTQTYDYDEVNRLKAAEEKAGSTSHWKQVYSYDRFGNRTLGAGTTYPSQLDAANNPQVSPTNNRITSPGYSYDEAGNLLCDPVRSCAQSPFAAYYAYDAENKMKSAGGGLDNGGTSYSYDGDGRRVKKATHHGEVTVFVYDAGGRVAAEYSNQVRYNGTSYLTQDHLGSTRAVTGQDQSVRARHDYFPFGDELTAGTGGRVATQGYVGSVDGVRNRYTGKERDDETRLDFFGARYYSSVQGRFTSVDPIKLTAERLLDPQRLNLYEYCRDNPLKYTDPDGEDLVLANATARARFRQVVAPGLTRAERRNLKIVGNQVQLRNPNLRGSSPSYGYLTQIISNQNLTVNYYAVAQGQTVTTATGATTTYQGLLPHGGGITTGNPGDSVRDVVIAVGGTQSVAGVPAHSGNTTPNPEDVIFAHEAYGHALDNDAIKVENEYRASRNPALPARSGEDHQTEITITGQPEMLQTPTTPPATQIIPRPLIPLPPLTPPPPPQAPPRELR